MNKGLALKRALEIGLGGWDVTQQLYYARPPYLMLP
jgi:hypothetical protein